MDACMIYMDPGGDTLHLTFIDIIYYTNQSNVHKVTRTVIITIKLHYYKI